MPSIDTKMPLPAYCMFGPAEVQELDSTGEFVRVRRSNSWEVAEGWARLAIGNNPLPQAGDLVLVAGELPDDLYVIGCLTAARVERIATSSGVYAERGRNEAGTETLCVLSPRDELLFEVDPANGATRLAIPSGRLELTTSTGDLVIRAGGTVRVEGHSIELQARHRLAMAVMNSAAIAGTWLRMLPERLQLGGERVELSAREGEIKLASGSVSCGKLSVETEQYQLHARSIETVAETIIERAGNVYRTVRDLVQHHSGRLRTYVSGLSHFRSKRAYFSSEETFHIDGEHVHLG